MQISMVPHNLEVSRSRDLLCGHYVVEIRGERGVGMSLRERRGCSCLRDVSGSSERSGRGRIEVITEIKGV
jgi:hypothetical protein